ncbi:MAG: hypothetical protein JXE06_01260, partial [Coriobacteriia bacterium]|nr:hypothetical protein [Coriobacteriia bacterium]
MTASLWKTSIRSRSTDVIRSVDEVFVRDLAAPWDHGAVSLTTAGCEAAPPRVTRTATVCDHGEDVRDDEDSDTPGEGDPDV